MDFRKEEKIRENIAEMGNRNKFPIKQMRQKLSRKYKEEEAEIDRIFRLMVDDDEVELLENQGYRLKSLGKRKYFQSFDYREVSKQVLKNSLFWIVTAIGTISITIATNIILSKLNF